MSIVIVKYNAGNIFSVECALKRLGVEPIISSDKEVIQKADKVIFPGVGEAASTMQHLRSTGLDKVIVDLKQPVLGICLGMQVLCSFSEEGNVDCLGIFDCAVKRFEPQKQDDKIPHMGWNTISDLRTNLFENIENDAFVYFVHSYYVPHAPDTIATTEYIHPFSAALNKDNFYATQFHPEKSGSVGEYILNNFLSKL